MDDLLKKAKRQSKKIIKGASLEAAELTKKIALDVEETALVQIKEMAAAIRQEVTDSKKAVDAELLEYKKQRMADIDEQVSALVVETSKKILGQAIDIRSHEELVIKALEDAKRSNIF